MATARVNSHHSQCCPGMTMLVNKSIIHSPEPVLCAFVHQQLHAPKEARFPQAHTRNLYGQNQSFEIVKILFPHNIFLLLIGRSLSPLT